MSKKMSKVYVLMIHGRNRFDAISVYSTFKKAEAARLAIMKGDLRVHYGSTPTWEMPRKRVNLEKEHHKVYDFVYIVDDFTVDEDKSLVEVHDDMWRSKIAKN